MPKTLLMLAMGCLVALSLACTKKASAPAGGGKGKDAGDTDDDGSSGGDDDGCSASNESSSNDDEDDDSSDDESAELNLLGGTTYSDIKDIFESNCVSCHGEEPTDNDIKLNTYDNVKDNAEAALASIEDGSMPQGGSLDDSDKEAIQAFIEDGLKEGSADGDDEESAGSSSNCGSSTDDGTEDDDDDTGVDVDNFDAVLNPPELAECHAQDKLFWRNGDATHAKGYCIDVQYPAAFECNKAGVLAAFGDSDEVKQLLEEHEAQGWTYDQCGIVGSGESGKPAVAMKCIEKDNGCVALKDADPKNIVIKAFGITTAPTPLGDMPPL